MRLLKVGIVATAALVSCNKVSQNKVTGGEIEVRPVSLSVVQPTSSSEIDDVALGKHIIASMQIVRSTLSPAVQITTAQVLVNIANNVFTKMREKEQWITLLSIESRFDNTAVSPVGAIGVGQLMPEFVVDFGQYCGIKNLKKEDGKDLIINATLSACLYRHLLEKTNGSVTLAASAYNAGLGSKTTKDLRNLRNINPETANYITRFVYVGEQTAQLVKDNPANVKGDRP